MRIASNNKSTTAHYVSRFAVAGDGVSRLHGNVMYFPYLY